MARFLQHVESNNLVVNSGISSYIYTMVGSEVTRSGTNLTNHFHDETNAFIKYMVLGTGNATPTASDTLATISQVNITGNGGGSIFGDSNHGSISVATIPTAATISNATGLIFTLELPAGEGNGSSDVDYTEGGLLWGIDTNGGTSQTDLILFSRVVFASITKNSSRSISLDWTFSLTG